MAIGAAVTAAMILASVLGLFDRLSLALLDYGFRHVAHIDADPRIVLVDIDDRTIERIGRWPWHRRDVADLIGALSECGAGIIAVDIVFSERQAPRLEHPSLTAASAVDPPATVLGDVSLDDAIHDDRELAGAIQKAGNVYLAMFSKLASPAHEEPVPSLASGMDGSQPLFDQAVRCAGGLDADALAPPDSDWGPGFRRIVEALAPDFSLTDSDVADRTGLPPTFVERWAPRARRLAAFYHVERALAAHQAPAPFEEVLRVVLPLVGADEQSSARAELRLAYDQVRAMEAAAHAWSSADRTVQPWLARAYDVAAPLPELGRAARGVALVTFEPDNVDGVLRHLPLLSTVGNTVVPHLSFAVACDLLRIDLARTTVAPGGTSLEFVNRDRDRRWRIPVGPDGKTLIHWHVDMRRPSWDGSFTHLPAARIMEIPRNRRAIQANLDLLALTRARAVQLRFRDQPEAWADYARQIAARNALRREGVVVEDGFAAVHDTERQTTAWLELTWRETEGLTPENAEEAAFLDEIHTLHRQLVIGDLARQVQAKNAALEKRNQTLAEGLRPILNGRVCFVGYTATALGDVVNSPVFHNMPGVLAHANLLNTMLQDRFPRMSTRGQGVLVVLLAGVLITVLTSWRDPRVSLLGVLLLMGLLAAGSGAALRWRDWYLTGTVPGWFTLFVSWAFITLFRQVVEQRERRLIARSLARQTSPAIAAQIARGATEADFAPQPAEVTCYFSDLQGFTTLSEAIGPERTKTVLNRYLGTMAEVLLRHGGSSKFMGDGIFAYFNSPIWTCAEHARAGCEAALACRSALDRLKQAEAGGANAKEFDSLRMRAGIHTGTVFAGSYGSGERAEYTCIGDTVNLAARLEPANKAFGTTILVSQATYEAVDEDYAFRWLGRLQVKGKTRAVMVYELLGRSNQVDETLRQYAEAFAEAMFLFGERRWNEALQALDNCARLREGDLALDLYESEIRRLRDDPPPPDWNRAIELTTK